MRSRDWFFDIKGFRVGFQTHRVHIDGEPYLDRYIVYLGGTLRLHKFWRGDDDRAPHDHPWRFWTFPLADYAEKYEEFNDEKLRWESKSRVVKRFRWHRREAEFRHIVQGRFELDPLPKTGLIPGYTWLPIGRISKKPFWTIVVSGPRERSWFFYPEPYKAIPWRQWK